MSGRRRQAWGAAVAVVLAVTGAAPAAADSAATAARLQDDFNGDGYADLAVAAPSGSVGGKAQAGYVAVLYGTAHGLTTTGRKVFSQSTAGVPGSVEKGDRFGSALTTADLNRDGYADLVVGVGGEDTASGGTDSGYVQVVWGGKNGLSGAASLATGKSANDRLGTQGRLTAADVDADGATDVVTVQNEKNLRVLKGPFAKDGSHEGEQVVTDRYNSRILDLAAGDVNGDGITDVVAAANDQEEWDSRRIAYWYGTRDGVSPYFTLVYDIDGAGLQGGENLDVGDVNQDGYDDIVVGRAVDGYDSDHDAYPAKGGRVGWIPGTANGPDGVAGVFLNQDSAGVPGTAEKGDRFGTDVQIGDVDGDGYPDVVTGLPGEDLGSAGNAGSVVVLRGGAAGLTGAGAQAVSQSTGNVPGTAESGDTFGAAVHLGDANADGRADLAVGAPGENSASGFVWTFRSGAATVVAPNGTTAFGTTLLGTNGKNAKFASGFAY
ncbi:VCBS repeat-containing protein [Streptomyces sp. S3(2020)]|uniref:FG-GAP-like repeat-containing protein n=1 Tax=Streptomyces sp. S3(2020) TaxID=2732044 RepID=UPI001487FEC1|nr:FG-GAP-like repeat-containing protein [Streptomyces sp. S3(2020)]NNN32736.1 VCBS repeat-containing protein [Streptomyces sp. S3(2020)]